MWKCFLVVLLLVGIAFGVPALVKADSSVDIVISASGWIAGAPGDFTLTYVSDYEIGISWEMGEDAENTMVRAAYGHVPTDRSDGYEVYSGSDNYATDTSLSLATPEVIYYRAWSQNSDGVWSNLFSSGDTGGFMSLSFLFLGLLFLALTLTLACFRWKDILLSYASALVWLAIGFWWLLGDITNLALADPWSKILVFVPFILFFVVIIRLIGIEVEMERKGQRWREWGSKPPEEMESPGERYKREIRRRWR